MTVQPTVIFSISLRVWRRYKNIKVYFNSNNLGVVKNYEKALNLATGDVIFLCDQDDVWNDDKVEKVLASFNKDNGLHAIVHDAQIIDQYGRGAGYNFFDKRPFSSSFIKNFSKNRFHGCCLAIKREVRKSYLPFPEKIPMHDWWIGLIICLKFKVTFINEPLLYYRKHENNQTGSNNNLMKMIYWRMKLLVGIIKFRYSAQKLL